MQSVSVGAVPLTIQQIDENPRQRLPRILGVPKL